MGASSEQARMLSSEPGAALSIYPVFIGCAGWSIGRDHAPAFVSHGTHLQRYASQLNAVEINSSFYRPHRAQTYARWADSVPPGFRFSVKVPKLISHEQRLQDCEQAIDDFLGQCLQLGDRLGCLLVQLPPSLIFEEEIADGFFVALCERFTGQVVLEPRHESWVMAEPMLRKYRIAQAAVDPSRISNDTLPAGWPGFRYWRMHGSPRVYYSAYERARLEQLANDVAATAVDSTATWCIFDNTASGAATGDALELLALLSGKWRK